MEVQQDLNNEVNLELIVWVI